MAEISKKRSRKNREELGVYFDYNLMFIVIFIVCFGLVMLYSASSYEATLEFGNSTHYLIKQAVNVVIGAVAMIGMSRMDYHILRNRYIALGMYVFSIICAIAVWSPIGIEANGARRWLNLGFMSFQVCEFVKVSVIILMAFAIDKVARKLNNFRVVCVCMLVIVLAAGVIAVITSDLSSGIIIAGIGFVMLMVASPKIWYFGAIFMAGVGIIAALIAAEPYRLKRVRVWLEPEKYPDDGGFQVLQSLYSVGSGGLFGKGLGNGIQKLGYVPEAQNDMIFTVVCEELGVVGGIAVILMFIFMIWRCMIVSNNAPDLFGSMLVIGVMAHIAIQALLNIAVVTNAMPNTGVTLPFLSYGGTSIIFILFEIGIVLSVSRRIRFE